MATGCLLGHRSRKKGHENPYNFRPITEGNKRSKKQGVGHIQGAGAACACSNLSRNSRSSRNNIWKNIKKEEEGNTMIQMSRVRSPVHPEFIFEEEGLERIHTRPHENK
uniref:Uncharacterized protein n=1 Tax=Timema poppense TaxID=170557 RepID=A0A7R9H1P8_TIMPO|nr:unnamed protein product [Timema poppensis]